MGAITWPYVVLTLGTLAINGFFAWLAHSRAGQAAEHAQTASGKADDSFNHAEDAKLYSNRAQAIAESIGTKVN